MGPRPRGRGMGTLWREGYRRTCASMGPRPRGRGMFRLWKRVNRRRRASMGPRPRGRGMADITPTMLQDASRFNGAAPARARNGHRYIFTQLRARGFNGAAPARARNELRLNRHSALTCCFNGAAPARARNGPVGIALANAAVMLQWGRARAGAECTLGMGKKGPDASKLQWGRARAGAECFSVFSGELSHLSASMGPRPRGRGMLCSSVSRSSLQQLQWGRARAGAE